MGLLDVFGGKKQEQKVEPVKEEGKYNQSCSLCSKGGTDKKWMGQYWHKKCMRQMKKGARKMV